MATQPVTHSLVKALRAVADFACLDDATLLEIVGSSACLFWSAGSTVLSKGDPAEALYVVLSGRVRIFDPADPAGPAGDEAADIGPGDYFAECAVLSGTAHSDNARTVEDSELMVIPKESLQPILTANPDVADRFRQRLDPASSPTATDLGIRRSPK